MERNKNLSMETERRTKLSCELQEGICQCVYLEKQSVSKN